MSLRFLRDSRCCSDGLGCSMTCQIRLAIAAMDEQEKRNAWN